MGKAYKKIFIGLLFIFLNIDVMYIDILPDFVGYMFIIRGITLIHIEVRQKRYDLTYAICLLLLIGSFADIFYVKDIHLEVLNNPIAIVFIIRQILFVGLISNILKMTIHLHQIKDNKVDEIVTTKVNNGYRYVMLGVIFVQTFFPNMSYRYKEIVLFGVAGINLIFMIVILATLNRARKSFV